VQVTDLFVGDMISDHALIRFKVQALKSSVADVQTVTSRAWRRLSRDAFAADLMETRLCSDMDVLRDMSSDDLVSLYCNVMTDLLDRHCPVVTVRRRARPMTPTVAQLGVARELQRGDTGDDYGIADARTLIDRTGKPS